MCADSQSSTPDTRAESRLQTLVLWSEVAVDNHVPFPFKAGNGRRINRLKRCQLFADKSQHPGCLTFVDQVLAVATVQLGQDEHRNRIIKHHNLRDRVYPSQSGETRELTLGPGKEVGPFVSFFDTPVHHSCAVGIAMREASHEEIVTGKGAPRNRRTGPPPGGTGGKTLPEQLTIRMRRTPNDFGAPPRTKGAT